MTDADAQLRARMRADLPPARDPWFRITVMERMARRRLRLRLAVIAAAGAAGAVLLAPFAPALAGLGANGALPAAGVLMALVVTAWGVAQMRRPI